MHLPVASVSPETGFGKHYVGGGQGSALIRDAEAYFETERFRLPPFAFWTPDDWASPKCDISEIHASLVRR